MGRGSMHAVQLNLVDQVENFFVLIAADRNDNPSLRIERNPKLIHGVRIGWSDLLETNRRGYRGIYRKSS